MTNEALRIKKILAKFWKKVWKKENSNPGQNYLKAEERKFKSQVLLVQYIVRQEIFCKFMNQVFVNST